MHARMAIKTACPTAKTACELVRIVLLLARNIFANAKMRIVKKLVKNVLMPATLASGLAKSVVGLVKPMKKNVPQRAKPAKMLAIVVQKRAKTASMKLALSVFYKFYYLL